MGALTAQDERDEEVLEALKESRGSAAALLLDVFGDRVYGLSLRILGSTEDARESVQETFLTIWRKWSTFRGKSKFSSWVYRVAANQAYMILRKRRRLQNDLSLDQSAEDDVSGHHLADRAMASALRGQPVPPDQLVQRQELRQKIDEAVESLPPSYRTAYMLKDIDGLPLREIADIVGVSEPAVKSRVHRARLRIRSRLSPYLRA